MSSDTQSIDDETEEASKLIQDIANTDVLASPEALFEIWQDEMSYQSPPLEFDSGVDETPTTIEDVLKPINIKDTVDPFSREADELEEMEEARLARNQSDYQRRINKALVEKEFRDVLYNETKDFKNPKLSDEVKGHIDLLAERSRVGTPVRRIIAKITEDIKHDAKVVDVKGNLIKNYKTGDYYERGTVLIEWAKGAVEIIQILDREIIPQSLLREFSQRAYATSESVKYGNTKTYEFLLFQNYSEYLSVALAILLKIFDYGEHVYITVMDRVDLDDPVNTRDISADLRRLVYFNPSYFVDKPFEMGFAELGTLYAAVMRAASHVYDNNSVLIDRRLKQLKYFNAYQVPVMRTIVKHVTERMRRLSFKDEKAAPRESQRLKRPSEVLTDHFEKLSRLGDAKIQNSARITIPINVGAKTAASTTSSCKT